LVSEGSDLAEMLREAVASYKGYLLRCRDEREVIEVLAAALGCRREVPTPAGTADLVCGDAVVEVEFEKRPYEGVCQLVFYKVLGGFPKAALVHVRLYRDDAFVNELRALAEYLNLKEKDIRCFILFVEQGEVVEI
jgi:hypothetical protein